MKGVCRGLDRRARFAVLASDVKASEVALHTVGSTVKLLKLAVLWPSPDRVTPYSVSHQLLSTALAGEVESLEQRPSMF